MIINRPLLPHGETWQPFPTLYWFVDPDLIKRVSDIERRGGVREIQQRLADDPALEAAHREDNVLYAKARWAVLDDKEKQAAKDLGMDDMLKHAGIGGVANHDAVKCLHAQYAFHLARCGTGTTVGRLMEKRLGAL